MAPKGPSKRPHQVTDFDKLKQEITTYRSLSDTHRPERETTIDRYYQLYQVDKLLESNVRNYDALFPSLNQRQSHEKLKTLTRDLAKYDIDADIGLSHLKQKNFEGFVKQYYAKLKAELKSSDEQYPPDEEPSTYLANTWVQGSDDDRNYDYGNIREALLAEYKTIDVTKGKAPYRIRPITPQCMRYLAVMLFDPEVLKYCACRITRNDDGDKDYQLVYLKNPASPRYLFLSDHEKYQTNLNNPENGWDDPEKFLETDDDGNKVKPGVRGLVFNDTQLGIDENATSEVKMKALEAHFQQNQSKATPETEYTSVTDDSASEFEASSIEATEDQGDQKLESAQSLSASRVIERTNLLKERCKQEGSFIYKMLNFFGINTDIVLGLVASNASIPDNELKLTLGAGMLAIAKSGFKRFTKHLPSSLLGIKEQDSEAKFPIEPELKDKPAQQIQLANLERFISQNQLHSSGPRTVTFSQDIDMKNAGIYIGKNTTILSSEPINFYHDVEHNKDIATSEDGKKNTIKVTKIKSKDPKGKPKFKYETKNMRAFCRPRTVKQTTVFEGYVHLNTIKHLKQYRTENK